MPKIFNLIFTTVANSYLYVVLRTNMIELYYYSFFTFIIKVHKNLVGGGGNKYRYTILILIMFLVIFYQIQKLSLTTL